VGGHNDGPRSPWEEMAPGETWSTTVYYATSIKDKYRELTVGASGESATFKLNVGLGY